jgi:hypothetical protein
MQVQGECFGYLPRQDLGRIGPDEQGGIKALSGKGTFYVWSRVAACSVISESGKD